MKYGYARTTPEHAEEIKQQTKILKEHGAEIIYEDISRIGKGKKRDVFNELVSKLVKGDVLIVSSLGRLANSFGKIFEIMTTFDNMGVIIISIRDGVNTGTESGKNYVDFIRKMILLNKELSFENSELGRLSPDGTPIHRPKNWTDEQALDMLDYQVNKNYSIEELTNKFGFSSATIGRILKRAREVKAQSDQKEKQSEENNNK